MGFGEAISAGFANYVVFRGRAVRSEYWYFVLFCLLVALAASIIDYAIKINVIGLLWSLATILPSLSIGARRLYDTDRSGWWQLIVFIPVIGWILLLVWMCIRGTPGVNRFG
jgi:uncharacterized membrane protein YhaH (DUF805 family)